MDIVWLVWVTGRAIEEVAQEQLEYVELWREQSPGGAQEKLLAIRHADTIQYKVTALAALDRANLVRSTWRRGLSVSL